MDSHCRTKIIPYSSGRPNYKDFRSCKYDVAKIMWDPEFNMEDSHVPLNPDLHAQENKHLGWNLANDELAKFIQTNGASSPHY